MPLDDIELSFNSPSLELEIPAGVNGPVTEITSKQVAKPFLTLQVQQGSSERSFTFVS